MLRAISEDFLYRGTYDLTAFEGGIEGAIAASTSRTIICQGIERSCSYYISGDGGRWRLETQQEQFVVYSNSCDRSCNRS